MSNPNAFALVWDVEWPSSYHLSVAMVLARFSDENGWCALKHPAIARMACCSRRQVQRVLDDMLAHEPPQIVLIPQPWENGGKAANLVQLTIEGSLSTSAIRRVSGKDFFRNRHIADALNNAAPVSPKKVANRRSTSGPIGAAKRAIGRSQYKSESQELEVQEPALGAGVDSIALAFKAYNDRAKILGLSIAEKLNEHRKKHLKSRIQESGIEGWARALDAIERSRLLMGERKTDRGFFKLTIDFLLQPSSFQKLIEGGFDDGRKPNPTPRDASKAYQERLRTDPKFGRTMAHQWTQDPDRWPPEAGPPPGQPGCVLPISVQDAVLGRGSPTGADALAHGVHALAQQHAHEDLLGVDLGREHSARPDMDQEFPF